MTNQDAVQVGAAKKLPDELTIPFGITVFNRCPSKGDCNETAGRSPQTWPLEVQSGTIQVLTCISCRCTFRPFADRRR